MYDTYVSSIYNYSCQIWGFGDSVRTETVHINFCKSILGLCHNVNNDCIYGELGRYPVSVKRKFLILKYWSKILDSNNLIIRQAYDMLTFIRGRNWAKKVKSLLESLGLGYYWLNQDVINENNFFSIVKQRLQDQFLQNWRAREFFCNTMEDNFSEQYYLKVVPENLRPYLSKFRCTSHRLEIETGRYQKIARQNRLCKL